MRASAPRDVTKGTSCDSYRVRTLIQFVVHQSPNIDPQLAGETACDRVSERNYRIRNDLQFFAEISYKSSLSEYAVTPEQ